jgi:mRNA-degrading endonuclease YafQ of YafQ-DinJ toxin-antitoxin module
VISILKEGHKLQPKYKDHPLDKYKELKGKGLRDCHIVDRFMAVSDTLVANHM